MVLGTLMVLRCREDGYPAVYVQAFASVVVMIEDVNGKTRRAARKQRNLTQIPTAEFPTTCTGSIRWLRVFGEHTKISATEGQE